MMHSVSARVAACLAMVALWGGWVGHAAAGPKEVFGSIDVASGNADFLTLRWINGEGGMFLSRDGGKTFRMTCFGAVDGMLQGKGVYAFATATDGSMCAGTGNGLWCSDAQGCGWKPAEALDKQWVADIAEDPLDKNVLYAVTGTSQMDNGVYKRESASAAWKPIGMRLGGWFTRLQVVKRGDGRRIWVSGLENVMNGSETAVKYYVRYSDDDAATWTSHEFTESIDRASLRLVAADPGNPDRIVVAALRQVEKQPDDLYYSDKRGEPSSFVKIGSVTELGGSVFLPDGALLYGDNDQESPGLYKVSALGEQPVKLEDSYKVGCLRHDATKQKLYVCADWRFGTADPSSGALTETFVINTADQLLECPGEPAMKEQCDGSLRSPNFCDITHWPEAPVCVANFGTMGFAGSGAAGASGSGGAAGSAPAAGGGGSADSSVTGAAGVAGARAAAGGVPAPAKRDGGCSWQAPGAAGSRGPGTGPFLGLLLVALAWFRTRRRSG